MTVPSPLLTWREKSDWLILKFLAFLTTGTFLLVVQ